MPSLLTLLFPLLPLLLLLLPSDLFSKVLEPGGAVPKQEREEGREEGTGGRNGRNGRNGGKGRKRGNGGKWGHTPDAYMSKYRDWIESYCGHAGHLRENL